MEGFLFKRYLLYLLDTSFFTTEIEDIFRNSTTEHSMTKEQEKFFNRGVEHGKNLCKPDLKEEKQTLSDKLLNVSEIQAIPSGEAFWIMKEKDGREALKKFIDNVWERLDQKRIYHTGTAEDKIIHKIIKEEAKETFGKKLI